MIAYLITNTVSGKQYVGISKHSTPANRWRQHQKQASKGSLQLLHRAIMKHGPNAFLVEQVACARTWGDLCATEVALIRQHGTFWFAGGGYNMTLGGDGSIGVVPSAETRAKNGASHRGKKRSAAAIVNMRAAQQARIWSPTPEHVAVALAASAKSRTANGNTAEHNALISAAILGRTHSHETRQKMSDARHGRKLSESHRTNIAKSLLGLKRPLEFRQKMSAVALLREARKKLLIAAIVITGLMPAPAHALIVVEDPASILQQVKAYYQDIKSYALAAQSLTTQVQQLATEIEQFNAFVHDPTLGAAMAIMNQAGLGNSLPGNPYALQSLTSGYGGLMGKLGALGNLTNGTYAQNHVYSPTDNGFASQQLIANGNAIAGTQGAAQAVYADMRSHMPVLQALRDRLATARTPKDVADAQAEVDVETAWIHSTNAQLAALQINYSAQRDAQVQRENEAMDQGIDDFLAQAKAAGRGL
jgi:type IV secretion system protein VirB5